MDDTVIIGLSLFAAFVFGVAALFPGLPVSKGDTKAELRPLPPPLRVAAGALGLLFLAVGLGYLGGMLPLQRAAGAPVTPGPQNSPVATDTRAIESPTASGPTAGPTPTLAPTRTPSPTVAPTPSPTVAPTPNPTVAPSLVASLSVPRNSPRGVPFSVPEDGAYEFRYVSGAYSTYRENRAPAGTATWIASVCVFDGSPIWDGQTLRVSSAFLLIGWGGQYWMTQAEAAQAAAGQAFQTELTGGKQLTMVTVDAQNAYADNGGSDVTIEIWRIYR